MNQTSSGRHKAHGTSARASGGRGTRRPSTKAKTRARAPRPAPPREAVAPAAAIRDEAKALFRAALLQGAENVFAEQGFHGARIQDIAKRARVAVGTVYNHFTRKEDLLVALLNERTREAEQAFSPHSDDPKDFEGRFCARMRRIHTFFMAHQAFFRVACDVGVIGAEQSATARILHEHLLSPKDGDVLVAETRNLLAEGVREGALERADPRMLERFLSGALRNVILGTFIDGSDAGEAFEAGLALFLRATRRRRPAKGHRT